MLGTDCQHGIGACVHVKGTTDGLHMIGCDCQHNVGLSMHMMLIRQSLRVQGAWIQGSHLPATSHLQPAGCSWTLAVHGLSLIGAAMRRTYRWHCVLHTDGLSAFPRRAADSLPTPYPLRTPDSLPKRCLALGTWIVEGLTCARKQLEIGGVLRQA